MTELLKAVYYCRVSTDDENQTTSIVNQKTESIKTIQENHWKLIEGYIDEGKSGTTTYKREEYNRLVRDMETDKFNIIVIKSQDRLMRNTKEWYFFIDKLVRHNKRLYFYLERKFYSPDDALITGIKAILAEDYSRSLSKNINNAHRKRQESGSSIVLTSRTWGYDKVDKKVIINEKEAEMVRFIYEMAVLNYGTRTISKMLEEKGCCNHAGKKIAEQTIRKIIRNPLYKGTAVMNMYHKDFETKCIRRNSKDSWIYHEGMVPAIVSEDIWETANRMMDARAKKVITEDFKEKVVGCKKNTNLLTGKIVCGICGNHFWRTTSVTGKSPRIYWNCSEYVLRGRKTCDNIHIKECDLDQIMSDIALKTDIKSENAVLPTAVSIMKKVIYDISEMEQQEKQLQEKLNLIIINRENLLDKYLENKIDDEMYQIKENSFKQQMADIQNTFQKLSLQKKFICEKEQRVSDLEKEIRYIADYELRVYNLKRHIKKIIVYPDYLLFQFDIFEPVKVEIKKINYRKREYYICL